MLYSEGTDFGGFQQTHLEAFEQAKWSSHRFNLERMKVSAALEALRRTLEALPELAPEDLSWNLSSAHPEVLNGNRVDCLWLYLNRPDRDRDAVERGLGRELTLADLVQRPNTMHRFAFTGLRVHREGLDWGLWLHAHAVLDRQNLEAALKDHFEATKLPPLLAHLPEGTQVHTQARSLPPGAWLEASQQRLEPWEDYLFLGRRLQATELLAAGSAIRETLAAELPSFLPLFRFLAWSSANDRLNLAKKIKEEKKERLKKASGLEPGDKVRVTRGLLSGQQGTVQELDNRGRAKVLLGRVTIELQADMLVRI